MRALIVEDDNSVADVLKEEMGRFYAVDHCTSACEGMWFSETNPYDVIILDINLPDKSGIEVCGALRTKNIMTPILILSSEANTQTIVAALNQGADDYLVKPFSIEELLARLRALRRRPAQLNLDEWLSVGDLRLNMVSRQLHFQGKSLCLRRKESELLEFILRNQQYVITREQMIDHLWNHTSNPFTNSINVHLGQLRKKSKEAFGTSIIETVHGIGYRLNFTAKAEAPTQLICEDCL